MTHLLLEELQVFLLHFDHGLVRLPVTICKPDAVYDVLGLVGLRVNEFRPIFSLVFVTRSKLLLKLLKLIRGHVESYIDLTHVEKVSCTFYKRHHFVFNQSLSILLFMLNPQTMVLVIVTPEDQIDPWNLFCEFFIVCHPHVSQRNDVFTPILLTESLSIFGCCPFIVLVNNIYFKILEDIDPLFFCNTDKAYLYACLLNDYSPKATSNAFCTIEGLVFWHKVCH